MAWTKNHRLGAGGKDTRLPWTVMRPGLRGNAPWTAPGNRGAERGSVRSVRPVGSNWPNRTPRGRSNARVGSDTQVTSAPVVMGLPYIFEKSFEGLSLFGFLMEYTEWRAIAGETLQHVLCLIQKRGERQAQNGRTAVCEKTLAHGVPFGLFQTMNIVEGKTENLFGAI